MDVTHPKSVVDGLSLSNDVPLNRERPVAGSGFRGEMVNTPNLVARVVEQLRHQILSGELGPDMELPPEAQMAETYGVSRTVVREAMRHLRAQDLVEVTRGRRPRVKPVDPKSAIDMLNAYVRRSDATLFQLVEVRRALESEVASLAAARATEQQIAAMVEANEAMHHAETSDARIRNDWLFHERFADASNNVIFVLLMKTIAGLFELSLAKTSHSDAEVAYASHTRLIAALRRRDPHLARSIALENLQITEYDLEQS